MCFGTWSEWRHARRETEKRRLLNKYERKLCGYLIQHAWDLMINRSEFGELADEMNFVDMDYLRLIDACHRARNNYRDNFEIHGRKA